MNEKIIIAALTKDRVIGINGKLPWHIPEDLKRFKSLTKGHTIIMGRKTFDEIGVLPSRKNIVVSKTKIEGLENIEYKLASDIKEALIYADCCANDTYSRVFIIGGAEIYKQTLMLVDRLELTVINGEYKGDTYFPEYEHLIGTEFRLVTSEKHDGYVFNSYIRIY